MRKGRFRVPSTEATVASRRARTTPGVPRRRALELVALRGKDVIGVRHVLDGCVYVGTGPDALARVLVSEGDGEAPVIAEVKGEQFMVRVPPRMRARVHGVDGLGRLLAGPVEVPLREGDRAVLVLGSVQVRAQIVPIEILSRSAALWQRLGIERSGGSGLASAARWIGLVGAIYIAALGFCAVFAPREQAQLKEGALRRAIDAAEAIVVPVR